MPFLQTEDEVSREEEYMNDESRQSDMQEIKATVWIGKQGVTPALIDEVAQQLKKRHRIKIKWLRNTDVDPEDLARDAGAILVEVRGRTAVFAERKS